MDGLLYHESHMNTHRIQAVSSAQSQLVGAVSKVLQFISLDENAASKEIGGARGQKLFCQLFPIVWIQTVHPPFNNLCVPLDDIRDTYIFAGMNFSFGNPWLIFFRDII